MFSLLLFFEEDNKHIKKLNILASQKPTDHSSIGTLSEQLFHLFSSYFLHYQGNVDG
jgi:hypothetical protein